MMNVDVKTLFNNKSIREMVEQSEYINLTSLWGCVYYLPSRLGWWELLCATVGEGFLKDSPWATYEEFLEADAENVVNWVFKTYPQIKHKNKMWKYYSEDKIKEKCEYFIAKNDVNEFFKYLEEYGRIEVLYERLKITIKKAFRLNYRNRLSKAAVYMFSGMISGDLTVDDIVEYSSLWFDLKFNTSNFNYQINLDLACKIVEGTLSDAEKIEVINLFNDIQKRFIA